MLENVSSAKERWGGVNVMIDRWLKERQQLIVNYCQLSRADDFDSPEKLRAALLVFCELLVDYVSAGHFEIYEQLIQEACEYDDGGLELVSRIFPRIEATTEAALEFNDRFDGCDGTGVGLQDLYQHVSQLGETLEERFELEDVLIEALHTAHADKVA
ncbi:sigma D regulator [Mangrovitalea sediminis]|uniref:sigma D regulator n=1 Tax=Mangrovitalea sediminis TaxID=1982043 RepID=UPI000BE5D5D0|nr:sigma D regulator [Mangrovitalea sediminis]